MPSITQYLATKSTDITHLLQFVLQKPRTFLYGNGDMVLSDTENTQLTDLIKQRESGKPLAYLVQSCGFYHLDFYLNEQVLIPRPETELLVDIALDLFDCSPKNILELATGSGAIAITLAHKRPAWFVVASDNSISALKVAQKNSQLSPDNQVVLLASNWFCAISPTQKFDLIVANPPYIAPNDSHLEALSFEPISALVAQNNGLADYQDIIKSAKKHLTTDGYLLLEHGFDQRHALVELLEPEFSNIQTFDDLNGNHRAILAR